MKPSTWAIERGKDRSGSTAAFHRRHRLGQAAGESGGCTAIQVSRRRVGFRYQIARRLGLWVGMDFAWSTVDRAFYIQMGNAWR